jgi:phosphatidylglycerol:prolipoprotein diacylglycerol transferase
LHWLVETSGLTMGQWLTAPMILVGLFLVFTAGARKQRAEAMSGSNSVT